MKITETHYYGGAKERIAKLGLASLFIEILDIIFFTKIKLLEEKDANGGAEVRKLIDESFASKDDWVKKTTGDIDWVKRVRYNRTFIATIGVEVQVSARSDLLIRDLVHIRNNLQKGLIEVGVIVVPSNLMQIYLPDRTPSIRDALKYIDEEFIEAQKYPIVVIAIEHDGPGPALKKAKKKIIVRSNLSLGSHWIFLMITDAPNGPLPPLPQMEVAVADFIANAYSFLPLALHFLTSEYERDLLARGEATPLVAGAAGDRYDLVLNGLYFTGNVPAGISLAEATALRADISKRELDAMVFPIHSRHRAAKYPLVGTDPSYFQWRGFEAVEGTLPLRIGDCVLGSAVGANLDLGPGDKLLTDRGTFFDLAGDYPLKMRVAGVLAPTDSPDDNAVFVDLKTAWIVDGISHGHNPLDEKTTLKSTGSNKVANAALFQFQEITDENIDSFHAHLPPEDLPLSCLVVNPATAQDQTLLTAAYNLSETRQMLESKSIVTELLGLVFKLKQFLTASFVLVTLATLMFIGLIILLSLRLRRAEMQTMTKIGCRRGIMAKLQLQEWFVLALAAVALSLLLAFLARAFAPDLSALM